MDVTVETARGWEAFAAGRSAEAAGCARRILERSPKDPSALTLLARLALGAGEPAVAHDLVLGVLVQRPESAASWLDLALALRDLGRQAKAAEAAERSVALDAGRLDAWVTLGEIRHSCGERAAASRAFRAALARAPDAISALRGFCEVQDVDPGSAVAVRMRALLESPSLAPAQAARLHYALARIERRAGEREAFVRHLFAANALQRSVTRAGRAEYAATFDRLEQAFTARAFAAAARAQPVEPRPVFILGMPRSGTTLLERLLAGHPDVRAGGELDYMRRTLRRTVERHTGAAFPEGFESISARNLNAMAQAFARRLGLIGQGAPLVTDKTPGNHHLLGLLRVLFPGSAVVHVVRDPMDTCFSILQQPFDEKSPHACDVNLLAYVYARYRRLMERWQSLFGGEFATVEYERLVAAPASEGRRLFGHCGLDWRDEYVETHRGRGAVRTFSAAAVREPIHARSVGAWREFEPELAPLARALRRELRAAGIDADTGSVS